MTVSVRTAKRDPAGAFTFYVSSFTRPAEEYAVRYLRHDHRRRWACTCPHWFHDRSVRERHCKHIRLVKGFVERAGGFRAIQRGITISTKEVA